MDRAQEKRVRGQSQGRGHRPCRLEQVPVWGRGKPWSGTPVWWWLSVQVKEGMVG